MDKYKNNNLHQNSSDYPVDFNLQSLLKIIYRRKNTVIISVVSLFLIAVIYSLAATPEYASSVTIKKELYAGRGSANELKEMLLMQSSDELDTEIEFIRTRTVLELAIKELGLQAYVGEIEYADGEKIEIDEPIITLVKGFHNNNIGRLPQFTNLKINQINYHNGRSYFIEVASPNQFNLVDEESERTIATAHRDSISAFDIDGIQFNFNWPTGNTGDKVYLETKKFQSSLNSLAGRVKISKKGKSNIFTVSYTSQSPLLAELIVTTLVEKYREYRLTVKRQETHNLFLFVDSQLKEISEKLSEAEIELSEFKSKTKIFDLDESSEETIRFLSDLETEKVKIDIELVELQNNLTEMKAEQQKKGYINQTYLAPRGEGGSGNRSPFSNLLEQLSDAEIRRIELMQKRREDHPDIVTIDNQIEQIKASLTEYNQNTMTAIQIMINTLTKKQSSMAGLINKYSAKLRNLPVRETKFIGLMRRKTSFEKMYTMLLDKREELRLAELSKIQDIVIIDPARVPLEPVSPKKKLNVLVGIIAGFVLGAVGIFVQELHEKKVTNIEEIEKQFSTYILAVIPAYTGEVKKAIENSQNIENRIVSLMDDYKEYLESYRLLRTRLYGLTQNDSGIFMVTSSEANTGKSTIVANLGVSLARTRKKVLLIDADLKKTGLTRLFNIPKNFPDIIEFLRKDGDVPILFRPFEEIDTNLDVDVLSGGQGDIEDSSELFELDKMKTLFKFAESKYDYVLIDTPPVTKLVDTLVIGKYIKNVIFVVRPKHSSKDEMIFGFDELRQSDLNLSGIVINASESNEPGYKYKYGYY